MLIVYPLCNTVYVVLECVVMIGKSGGGNQESSDHLLGQCNIFLMMKNIFIYFFITISGLAMSEVKK